jgi:ABC-type multidrug transport system fused ATPase/permease subunit
LEIKRGDFVGIVGSSGAGKTTLVDLMLALLRPTAGDILVNGLPLQHISSRGWRRLIGYVPQETVLFNDSIMNNITLLREGVTAQDAIWAARVADAAEFIHTFPEGFDTLVGDRGAKVSGGQRQRLALARALAHRPQILLLDEATSSLDSFSEQKIQNAIEELRDELTIIVVAHRLSTVMNADRIIVLDAGEIVEQGNPRQLIESDSKFRDMHALQAVQESV